MIEYKYLRPEKAKALRKWHEGDFYKKEKLECFHYENATILPIRKRPDDGLQFGCGGVIDATGTYVEKSGIESRVGGLYEYTTAEKSDRRVVYCGYWVKQWGHFLVEGVARLWYFLENDHSVDKYIFISEEGGPTEPYGNYLEFFKLLGLADKLEIINRPVQYREVLVPELGYSRKYYFNERYKQVFDVIAEKALSIHAHSTANTMPEKVFLSRSQFAKAQQAEVGLDYLDHYFSKNGYTILYPEKMSLAEMIRYLHSAKICAAESGTVPHNFLFAQNGKQTVIVERQVTVNEIQANLDIVCGLNVTYIDGHYSIYPVSAGYGPYIFGYTPCFKAFSEAHGYLPPDEQYFSERYYKSALKKYMKVYRMAYGYCAGMSEWQMIYAIAMYEAYQESLQVFGEYLIRSKPFCARQLLEPHFVKQLIKRLLGRV